MFVIQKTVNCMHLLALSWLSPNHDITGVGCEKSVVISSSARIVELAPREIRSKLTLLFTGRAAHNESRRKVKIVEK